MVKFSGVVEIVSPILTSAPDEDERQVSRLCCFASGERALIGQEALWPPKAGLDPVPDIKPVQPVVRRHTDWAISALLYETIYNFQSSNRRLGLFKRKPCADVTDTWLCFNLGAIKASDQWLYRTSQRNTETSWCKSKTRFPFYFVTIKFELFFFLCHASGITGI
jgi:hypothetical protein